MFREGSDLPDRGWTALINRLHRDLVVLDPDYRLDQVKEKFGALRFYAAFDPVVAERCNELVMAAAHETMRTCEVCGDPGGTASWWFNTRALT